MAGNRFAALFGVGRAQFRSLVAALTAVPLVSACIVPATGVKVEKDTLAQFTIGKTTCDEVIAKLGEPSNASVTGDERVLLYSYTSASFAWVSVRYGTNTFKCNRADDILKAIDSSNGKGGYF